MSRTKGQTRRARAATAWSLALLVLAGACSRPAAAQGGPAPKKQSGVGKLVEVIGVARQAAMIFDRLLAEYEGPWTEAMVANVRTWESYKAMPAAEASRFELNVREFNVRLFKGIKARAGREINSADNWADVAAPIFERHFTPEEVAGLVEVFQSPAGRKAVETYPVVVADALVAVLREEGFYDVPPDPDAVSAKMDRLAAKLSADPDALVRRVYAKASFGKAFTQDDLRAWAEFSATPLGRKVAAAGPRVLGELFRGFNAKYSPRIGPIAGEVFQEELKWLGGQSRP